MAEINCSEQIGGALACIQELTKLERSAENLPEQAHDAEIFYQIQKSDAASIADAFGPMTARQRGAFLAMAEYIHSCLSSGIPNLDLWRPIASLTPAEFEAKVAKLRADMAAMDAEPSDECRVLESIV